MKPTKRQINKAKELAEITWPLINIYMQEEFSEKKHKCGKTKTSFYSDGYNSETKSFRLSKSVRTTDAVMTVSVKISVPRTK